MQARQGGTLQPETSGNGMLVNRTGLMRKRQEAEQQLDGCFRPFGFPAAVICSAKGGYLLADSKPQSP